MNLYLKVNDYKGYDTFYMKIDSKDKTWQSILDLIEPVLDDKYIKNDDNIVGVKLSVEVVDKLPEDIEAEKL